MFLALPYSEIPGPAMNLMITGELTGRLWRTFSGLETGKMWSHPMRPVPVLAGAIALFGLFMLISFKDATRRLDFDFGKVSSTGVDDVFLGDAVSLLDSSYVETGSDGLLLN